MALNSEAKSEWELSAGATSADNPSLTVEQAIANLQQTEDTGLRYYAAWWLGRFRVTEPAAFSALLAALADETDRTPDGGYSLRRNAAKALGKLGDARAVPALINCLSCEDYYVRESAAQSLEMLGDSRAIAPLSELLTGGVAAAQMIPGKPHLVQPYEAIIEALGALEAVSEIPRIEPFLEHFLPKVQYAAARAMYQLTRETAYGERLVAALLNENLSLRRSALMDLGAIGYLPAAKAIGETLAENSLKLIALKGLLERNLEKQVGTRIILCPKSIEVMELMDRLL